MTHPSSGSSADRFAIVFQKLAEIQSGDSKIRVVLPDPFRSELEELEQLRKIAADIRHPYQPFYTGT